MSSRLNGTLVMENNEYKEREMPQVSKMPPHPKKK